MDWVAIKAGFDDEILKIAEVSLAGLSAETLMDYPKPEPMPSAGYEKAQQIIAKMQPKSEEKVAAVKDVLKATLKSVGKDAAAEGRKIVKRTVTTTTAGIPTYLGIKASNSKKKTKKKKKPKHKVKRADAVRPDQMPQLKKLLRKRKKSQEPPPDKIDNALSYGGNTLAGAGAAKFLGDWAEKGIQSAGGAGLSNRAKMGIMTAGGMIGLANKLRKDYRRKKWEQSHPG
jgi:hypothetical protein